MEILDGPVAKRQQCEHICLVAIGELAAGRQRQTWIGAGPLFGGEHRRDSHDRLIEFTEHPVDPPELRVALGHQLVAVEHGDVDDGAVVGDDDVLARMNRHYDAVFFRRLVERIVAMRPDTAVGLDVMVGFPEEDERAFQNTCRLIEDLPVAFEDLQLTFEDLPAKF